MEKINKNKNVPQDIKLEYVPTEKQMELHTCTSPFILFGGSIAGGKAIGAFSSQILTPQGFKCMGDINAGDTVFDMEGTPVRVLTCTDHTYNHKCYELEFDGGEKVIADAEHLWVAYSRADRIKINKRTDEYRAKRRASRPSRSKGIRPDVIKKNQEKVHTYLETPDINVITTEEMFKNKFIYRPNNPPMGNYSIPVTKPLQFTEKKYKVSPYALGAFLGDGCIKKAIMTSHEDDIQTLEEISKEENLYWRKIRHQHYSLAGFAPRLKEIGVLNNKHVPTEYLFGSYEQRLALVQGLMDTDGTILKNGKCEFTSSLENLSESLAFVLRSLGIKCNVNRNKATLYGRRCKDRYRVSFHTTLPVFRLKRKLDRLPKKLWDTCKYHYITDIKEVDSVPVKCIAVDSPTKTYLATKSLIPTHNSVAGVNDMLQ
ncbi:MAG: LAGLIDADG family homing endonuclease, partial [Candidatus Gracilibacteria bacterium]|nr:LAGLIDADG family homing endonuclease [Candidatus Gracilibacteria bacterium]